MRKTGLIKLGVLLFQILLIFVLVKGPVVEAMEQDRGNICVHEYELIASSEVSCYQNVYETYKCTICQEEKTEVIAARRRHRAITQVITQPTFTKKGMSITFCDDCEQILSINWVRKDFDLFKLICVSILVLGASLFDCLSKDMW